MATQDNARERAFREIVQEAQPYAARWTSWGNEMNAVLDRLAALMEQRDELHAAGKELHGRARTATLKHRGDLAPFEAESAKDYMAVKRAIDNRYAVHGGMTVTVVGIPTIVVGLLQQAVRERVAKARHIRNALAERDALKDMQPDLMVRQPGHGVYHGVNSIPEAANGNGGRGGARFADEVRFGQINRDRERDR